MSGADDYLPTATLQTLRQRAVLLEWLRSFFRDSGYWEVQTPVLSRDVCVDLWLEPFEVTLRDDGPVRERRAYLQTSPEFAMKRLMCAGADAIFQIGPVFRGGESGALHDREFTMIEWYRRGDSYQDQMTLTENLVAGFLQAARKIAGGTSSVGRPFRRLCYDEAFEVALGTPVMTLPSASLRELAAQNGITAPASLEADDRDGWLNLLLSEAVEPALKEQQAVFVYDYPASQAALARVRNGDPPVAERFELYLHGIEICNGYQELTDAVELKRRFKHHAHRRAVEGLVALPQDSRLLAAMEAGLPECSGVALGFERLLMIGLGKSTIADVMAFAFPRS